MGAEDGGREWLLDGNRVLSALYPLFLNALCGWLGAGCWKVWKQEVIPALWMQTAGMGVAAGSGRALRETGCSPLDPPLSKQIKEGGKADLVSSRLQAGDEVVNINEVALSSSRREAISLVKGSYKTLRLVVCRQDLAKDTQAQEG